MRTKLNKRKLKNFAIRETEADMIGIANIERFDGCPEEFHPKNLNKHTRSIIVVGMRIIRGALRPLEQGTGRIGYNTYGYGGINVRWMPNTLRKIAIYIEDSGYEAVPVIQWTGMPPLEPIINHRLAAVAAGLGVIGHSKIVLSKKYGPVNRFGIILSDAPITPDPIQTEGICDNCMMCVKDCPVHAISQADTEEVIIEGHRIHWGKLDVFLCGIAHPGAHPTTTPYIPDEDFDITEEIESVKESLNRAETDIERRAIAEEVAVKVKQKYHHPIHIITHSLSGSRSMCGGRGCLRSCLAHLESKGFLDSHFDRSYRQRGEKPEPMHTYTQKPSNAVVQQPDK